MRPRLFIVFFVVLAALSSFAQKRKEIKDNRIQGITEWQYTYAYDKAGQVKETKYKLHYTRYDKSGNMTEEVDYNPDGTGTIKRRKTYAYDGQGNKTEETTWNPDGTVKQRETFKYASSGLRLEKKALNAAGKPESGVKTEYTYY